jgi:outer membrane immunogenic protein
MKTKNSLLFFFALTMISTTAFSQVDFGLRNGVTVSTFAPKGDLLDNTNVTFSYTIGAFSTLPVSKSFAFRPEINYVRKGRNEETSELNTTAKTDFKIDYLQVPVLFQYRDNLNDKGSLFYVEAGPYAGFALNTLTHPSKGNDSGLTVQAPDSKKTDWGAAFGIGFQAPIWKQNFCFNLRYDMGMSEIGGQPSDYHTKALSLTVGIVL